MSEVLTLENQPLNNQKEVKKTKKKKFYIETLGCQMNVADSELIIAMLNDEGLIKSNNPQNSDLIFINTCSIREKAEEKVYGDDKQSLLPGPTEERELFELTSAFQASKDDLIAANPSGYTQA